MFEKTDKPYPADIRPLTSLRFFAAYCVVILHFSMMLPGFYDIIHSPLRMGYLAVDFFFILSGFILTHSYIMAVEQGRFSRRDFYIKRLARVYPVHFVNFIILVLGSVFTAQAGYAVEEKFSVQCFASTLLMVQAWGFQYKEGLCFHSPSWSVSAEWFAYLAFPFLAFALLKLKPVLAVWLSLLLFLLLYALYWFFMPVPLTHALEHFSIFRILPEFMMGMSLYLYGRGHQARYYGAWPFLVLAAVIFALSSFGFLDFITVPLLAALIFIGAEQARRNYRTVLDSKALYYLGEVSYSIYMVHMAVIALFSALIHVLAQVYPLSDPLFYVLWAGFMIFVIPVSMWMYTDIEMPARHYITRKFIKR